jgi:hypothetical protein
MFSVLIRVDRAYRMIRDNLVNPESIPSSWFVLRAHACWMASAGLAAGGQVYECYPVLRACIENSVYGFHVHANPESTEIWGAREKTEKGKPRVSTEFAITPLMEELRQADPQTGRATKTLYDLTVTLGGHPNPLGLSTNWRIEIEGSKTTHRTLYLNPDPLAQGLAIKLVGEVGVCTLATFKNVWPERYELVGLSDELRELKTVVDRLGRL